MEFRENLKMFRQSAGLTQTELATKVGVSTSIISQYENGAKSPTLYVADNIAKILGVTCDELLHGKEE